MRFEGLRFKGVIKEKFRKQFEPIALYGAWEDSADPVFKRFANDLGARYIPTGTLNGMPDSWNGWVKNNTEIKITYDVGTGYWTFQCSAPYAVGASTHFINILPYFVESVEYCEVFMEGWDYSHKYELVDNAMKLTDKEFISYVKKDNLSLPKVMRWNEGKGSTDEICCDIPLGKLCLFRPLNEGRILFAHMAGMVVDDFADMSFLYVLRGDSKYYFSREVVMYSDSMRSAQDAEKYFASREVE